jgi:primosomal protein N' (replication factor Y)
MADPHLFAEVAFNLPVRTNFTYAVPAGITVNAGQRVTAPFGSRKLIGVVVSASDTKPAFDGTIRAIDSVLDPAPLLDDRLIALARWMERTYMCSLGEAFSVMLPSGKREKAVEDVCVFDDLVVEKPVILSAEQECAVRGAIECGEGTFYLYGITGSGKTEVYVRIASELIARGKSIIYLVPEISLTHQVTERLTREFGDAAVIHSGLTPSQKLTEWRRIQNGDVSVVIGARSAVFAPVRRLGLVIIDEEHDGSYKSSNTPRFHARQIARRRAETEKALCIMGSATPSIEAYHAFTTKSIASFRLTERLAGGKMPEIEIVDLRGTNGPFSSRLVEEMKRVHALGRQTILFLNRRGFAYFFHCRVCGFEMTCKHCSVALTFHKRKWMMVCHYCGYAVPPVHDCPECGSLDVGYSGFGTEKIEEDIEKVFPDFRVARLDTDTVGKKRKLKDVLAGFRNGKIDVLLGTQMVAKGFHFPGVMLVGIINADTGLHLPDFRAYERTFNLIVQVSGRAGRTIPDGKVIVQTFSPQNEAIVAAARGRNDEFYGEEIERRRELGFPPFTRIIRIVFRSTDSAKAEKEASVFCSAVEPKIERFADVLGPADCPISIISGKHRVHVIFRSQRFAEMHATIRTALRSHEAHSDVYIEIDVDPISLL